MRVGLCFDGFYSIREMIELARMADRARMDSIWMSDHICFRDSIAAATAFLASTRKISVVPAPLSPYSRHPMVTAMALSTMEELAPGRVGATAGTANPTALGEIGISTTRPLQTMREYLAVLRALLSGERVHFAGEVFSITGAQMGFTPSHPIPIYMTAVRPAMLRLAGEIADGVLLSAGCAPAFVGRCVAEFRRGMQPRPSSHKVVAGFIAASVSNSSKAAMDATKTFLAYILRNKHHEENIRAGGAAVDHEQLATRIAKRDWEGAKKLVSDEVVFAHSVSGTPSECRKRLDEFVKGGLDLPILMPLGTKMARKRVVGLAKELI